MSYNSDPEKAFNVVFERQTPMSDEEIQLDLPILSSRTKTGIIKDVSKQVLKKSFEEIPSEHPAKDRVDKTFSHLLDAVGHAAVQENRATDKFVDDVEQMMNCFGKLQTAFKNIMEKLPKNEST